MCVCACACVRACARVCVCVFTPSFLRTVSSTDTKHEYVEEHLGSSTISQKKISLTCEKHSADAGWLHLGCVN